VRHKNKKFVLSKASLKELESERDRLISQSSHEKQYLIYSDLKNRIDKIYEIKEAMRFNSHVLYKLSCQTRVKPGLINLLVHNTEITPEALVKIDKGKKIQQKLTTQLKACDPDGCDRQISALSTIEKNEKKIDLIERKIKALNESKNNITVLKNKAAAHALEKRIIGNSLRHAIQRNVFCPYCLKKILDGGHIDHIYPIAKGGHSVKENMIHVCAKCNSNKSDLTLNQFMEKFYLNREEIETRLKNLGKII
jgi:5-methylcytosine-specific restriction endonuclease McrA